MAKSKVVEFVREEPSQPVEVMSMSKMEAADAKLVDKYPHYVKGSVHTCDHSTKLMGKIKCVKCQSEREVFTSDIFQVKVCKACHKDSKRLKPSSDPRKVPVAAVTPDKSPASKGGTVRKSGNGHKRAVNIVRKAV